MFDCFKSWGQMKLDRRGKLVQKNRHLPTPQNGSFTSPGMTPMASAVPLSLNLSMKIWKTNYI